MITSIRLQNFKAHRDTTVMLGRFTVLVGPNGAGKTSVLEALYWLSRLILGPDDGSIFSRGQQLRDIERRNSTTAMRISAEGDSRGIPWTLSFGAGPITWSYDGEEQQGTVREGSAPARLLPAIGRATVYRFDAQSIASAARTEESVAPVTEDGGNTAAVLSALKIADDERFDRILEKLCKIIPNVERIRVRRLKSNGDVLEKVHFDLNGAPDVPAEVVSEGTLIVLALVTAVTVSTGPTLLLLDDVDRGLHPVAQIDLVRQMKALLAEMPDVQIVATTHSPYVLDDVDAHDVQVLALRNDGSVAIRRLSEHPDASKMKGALSPGQIWTLDPEERWVAGERR